MTVNHEQQAVTAESHPTCAINHVAVWVGPERQRTTTKHHSVCQ